MFLFIFESIGTSELLLIGVVALIFLGPRKLPQMAKTIGKSMAEFRKATNEFKSTWEREVDLESYESVKTSESIPRESTVETRADEAPSIIPPVISPVDDEKLKTILPPAAEATPAADHLPGESDKRSWL
jgi:Tat protein translocase TatB subunit